MRGKEEGGREGGQEEAGRREGGREGGQEEAGRREGGREGEREGRRGRERGREGEREGERFIHSSVVFFVVFFLASNLSLAKLSYTSKDKVEKFVQLRNEATNLREVAN